MQIKSLPINKPLSGKINIPGDKSISHRSVIISSISKGKSIITNLLESEDVQKTLNILKELGVKIQKKKNNYIINGKGLYSLKKSKKKLYLGNAGTSARLLIGLLSAQKFQSTFTGDKSLNKRPMDRIINPLIKMGAKFKYGKNKKLPIKILGGQTLKPIKYSLSIPSAQIKSGIILASLYSKGKTIIIEKNQTRDHTEKLLKFFNSNIIIKKLNKNKKIIIKGKKELKAKNIIIPSDFSSASFFIIAALIIKDSKLTIKNVNLNKTRTGLLTALNKMNANIKIRNKRNINGELVGDIYVSYSRLKGCILKKDISSLMIDEYPILAVASSFASTSSIFYGLDELKHKESNRLLAIKNNLIKCGIKCYIKKNNLVINPNIRSFPNKIIKINSNKDHRIAMAFAIMGMVSKKGIIINEAEYINTSFPNFTKKINRIGAKIIEWKNW